MDLTHPTKQQALKAGLLLLAGEAAAAAALPGATIAQQAAAVKPGAAGVLGHGTGPPKKVASPKGAAFFKTPIGSLIIPHEHHGAKHFVKGEPSHWTTNISEAKWIANQWKDHPEKADEDAHKAVEAGTHKWVQSGDHEFAVHKDLDVHVPNSTDVHNPAAVKAAPKIFAKQDEHGEPAEHVYFHPDHPNASMASPTTKDAKHLLDQHWKKLPETESRKAVSVDGKHAAWVPSGWKVYKAANTPEAALAGKFARDPEGTWHYIDKSGEIKTAQASHDDWVKEGAVVADDDQPEKHAPLPVAGEKQPGKLKAEIAHKLGEPPLAVTKEEIQHALKILQDDKSTAVKQPLAKAGHPLAAMDYHAISQQELAKHPELKIPPGTKKEHVGQVKSAVIHHLAGRVAHLSHTEAESAALDSAKDKVQAEADHAQLLTPHTFALGGVTATREDAQGAIDALNAAKSTSIKQVLKAKGNPLAESDYWKVISEYKAEHPNWLHTGVIPAKHGTKQEHVGSAKALFIAALTEKAGLLAKADQATGHDHAAELYDLAKNGTLKSGGGSHTMAGAVAEAAQNAVMWGELQYAQPAYGSWEVSFGKPNFSPWYKVTPQLKATDQYGESADTLLWNAAHMWITPKGGTEAAQDKAQVTAEKAPEPSAAALLPDWVASLEQKDPQWQEIDAKIASIQPTQLYAPSEAVMLAEHFARMLVLTDMHGSTQFLTAKHGHPGEGWEATKVKPPEGTYAAPSMTYFYEVTSDHRVIMHTQTGTLLPKSAESVLNYLKNGLKIAEAAKEPQAPEPGADYELVPESQEPPEPPKASEPPAGQGVPALTDKGIYAGEYPPGSQVYKKTGGSYDGIYARDPSGQWWRLVQSGGGPFKVEKAPSYTISDSYLPGHAQSQYLEYLEPLAPPSMEQVAHGKAVADALSVISTGTMDGSAALHTSDTYRTSIGLEKVFPTWAQAAAYALTTTHKVSTELDIVPDGNGYRFSASLNHAQDEHWRVSSKSLEVSYTPQGGGGKKSEELRQQLLAAVKANVIPNAVSVDGKVFAAGYWKNPKGKTYILVKPNKSFPEAWKYGTAAYGQYVYFDSSGGSTEITPVAAAKHLAKATQWSGVPFPQAEAPPDQVAYATVLAPESTLKLWSATQKAPEKAGILSVKKDGSALWEFNDGAAPSAVTDSAVKALLSSGTVLDQYGTSVVLPGLKPFAYHIWGSEAKTASEVKDLLDKLIADPLLQFAPEVQKFLAGDAHENWGSIIGPFGKPFMADHHAVNGDLQKAAFLGLLRELLAVPGLPEGAKVSTVEPGAAVTPKLKSAEPVFFKSMPEGVTEAKDIFTWTAEGWALPYAGVLPAIPTTLSKAVAKSTVQAVSQQFGNGLVVGTHLSALSAYGLAQWLIKWKHGDMKGVFALDAQGGKVSPAHPGAPDNVTTHSIMWSPLDPHQVPASHDIPGEWSNLAAVSSLPEAEVANYLIKMGFQHAEYLQAYEKQLLVRSHRIHVQDTVDELTAKANERFAQGLAPKSEPPVWTPGLKPAKPYASYLASSTPAGDWSESAVQVFTKDHEAELASYIQQIATDNGYSVGYIKANSYYLTQAIQGYFDGEYAKVVAEQSVPVWKKVPTGDLPSHGHEVWKATRTIPFTGESTTWFVKPAPDGKVFRLEQEHAANQLGRLLGFQSAESQLLTGSEFGQTVQAQKAIPGEPLGHYTGMPPWPSFTSQQVGDIAAEHLLDWVLSNDDSSANNMIKTPGGRIVGIDKGRSWGNLDWQGLAGNSAMDSMTQLVYTKLYDGIRNHQITKDVADQVFLRVIQQARKMQAVSDVSVRNLLEQGFAHRAKWGSLGSKQALIDEVLRRKNSLADDFTKMWAQVYKDAGFGGQSQDFGKGKPWGEVPGHNPRFGLVVLNKNGQVLLREVKNHFGGATWTFSKGGPNPGETSLQAAIRESAEELGSRYQPVGYVPGAFTGTSSTSYFYLAQAEGAVATPELDNGETEQVMWATPTEAKDLLAQSESQVVVLRDLSILSAALKAWQGLPAEKTVLKSDPAGTGLPEVPVQKLPDAHGAPLHSGFSEPGFTDHVTAAKSHGAPAFFGGPELRDMHVLVWQQNDSQGARVTHGETFLEGSAYDKVVSWLKSHSGMSAAPADDDVTSYPGGGFGPGKPPMNSPDRGDVTGEASYYRTIIGAARSAVKHKIDGDYTSSYSADTWANFEEIRKKLQELRQSAELEHNAALTEPAIEKTRNLLDMATLYLDYTVRVQAARDGKYGFAEGDLPRWLPSSAQLPETKDELAALGIKLESGVSSEHSRGSLDENTGEFIPSPDGSTSTVPGKWWHMTLPDGEVVELGDGQDSGIALAHWGRVRFSTGDGSAASLEHIRAALQLTGLEMREAEVTDFELFYWRHLLAIMNDRKNSSQQPVWKVLQDRLGAKYPIAGGKPGKGEHRKIISALAELGKTDPVAEVQAYRAAFAALTSPQQVQEWADRGGFLPVQKHFDPTAATVAGGKPDWYRLDLASQVASLPMPIRQSTGSGTVAAKTVKGGGFYSKDALMRVAGIKADGMGNPYESGATAFVFTRLNVDSHRVAVFSPLTLARSHNYSYSDDFFGNTVSSDEGGYNEYSRRENASWGPAPWSGYSDSSNETMISDALSLLDDMELVEAYSPEQRAELISWLKAHGISEIRHMPVEDRVVLHIGSASIAKVKANYAAHPELLDPLAEHGLPAYTGATEPAAKAAESGRAAVQEIVQEPAVARPAVSSGDFGPASPAGSPSAGALLDKIASSFLGQGWESTGKLHWKNAAGYSISSDVNGFSVTDPVSTFKGVFGSLGEAKYAAEHGEEGPPF